MNISTIIEAFNEMCPTETTASHVDGNAPVILTKRSTLSKEEMENFLQEKLSALLDEIVEEMKGHNLIKNPNKNLDITKICYIEGYNEALGDVAAIVEAKK